MTSRRELPPSWAELVARAAVADVESAAGVWRHTSERGSYGWFASRQPVRVVAPPRGTDVAFRYRRPDAYRLETAEFLFVSDATTSWLREPDGEVVSAPAERMLLVTGPMELLQPDIEQRFPHQQPEPEVLGATQLLGRTAWHCRTAQSEIWVDDATGVLLRRVYHDGSVTEFDELTTDEPVDGFTYGGRGRALELPEEDGEEAPPASREPRQPRLLPTLSYWPDGEQVRVVDGDPASGAFRGMLPVAYPGTCVVARTPSDTDRKSVV